MMRRQKKLSTPTIMTIDERQLLDIHGEMYARAQQLFDGGVKLGAGREGEGGACRSHARCTQ